ncbi:hypothetical protein AB6A40_007361 [Gnathostoma spinigerum]|uniref:Carboxypeptidase n=1 Tax=Gnathostoma spinigerum TaxID=75299 RepID=A0ABD6EN73_9BILA
MRAETMTILTHIYLLATVAAREIRIRETPHKILDNKALPGATFQYSGRIESGYLNGSEEGNLQLFYMFFESESKAENVPLLLWLNGGPGCSSLFGAFVEIGPFLVNKDGKTLYQNAYSFGRVADLLFLETPIGTGFSYDTKNLSGIVVGDDETAKMNSMALQHFFNDRPYLRNRDFFIAGESYAGVYISTLAREIVKHNLDADENSRINLKGIMVGNGMVDAKILYNSMIPFMNYHGFIDGEIWEDIKEECCDGNDVDECDFSQYGTYLKEFYIPSYSTQCGKALLRAIMPPEGLMPYDINQQCYKDSSVQRKCFPNDGNDHNTAWELSYESTDPQLGLPCWYEEALKKYFNRDDVQQRIHIKDEWRRQQKEWTPNSLLVSEAYEGTYHETAPIYKDIIDNLNGAEFRVLIYNGDMDLVCNARGADKFGKILAKKLELVRGPRNPWYFRGNLAGYQKSYTNGKVTVDVLTVKGAGHFAPMNRPGPCLQMYKNFFAGSHNYTLTDDFNANPIISEDIPQQ